MVCTTIATFTPARPAALSNLIRLADVIIPIILPPVSGIRGNFIFPIGPAAEPVSDYRLNLSRLKLRCYRPGAIVSQYCRPGRPARLSGPGNRNNARAGSAVNRGNRIVFLVEVSAVEVCSAET